MTKPNNLPQPEAILLDMDGVLYHGEQAISGAVTFVSTLADIKHAFITNNPIRSPHDIAVRLQRLGFRQIDPATIITSAEVTASWLQQQKPDFRYFAVGGEWFRQVLAQYGTYDEENADFVVIGEGEGLDYRKLTIGLNLMLQRQARLIATNPDETVDASINGKHLVLPGGGALVAPFAVASGRQPVFIGKPYPLLYEQALLCLGVNPEKCLMIGDRPDTDIKGAAALGMQTALVRSGRFAPGAALPSDCPAPDLDADNLPQLYRQLAISYPGWLAPAHF